MDGDPVTGEPSQPLPRKTMAEIFYEHLPYYLAIGMSADEYWNGSPSLVVAYRNAHEIMERRNEWARWRQGAYFYDALLKVAPVMRAAFGKGKVEPGKYPTEPWPVTEKDAREREERQERENYERFVAQLEADHMMEKRKAESAKKEASENV